MTSCGILTGDVNLCCRGRAEQYPRAIGKEEG